MSKLEQFGQIPNLPRDEEGPMFAEPWQLTAFSIVVSLYQKGHFEWKEWVNYLSEEIALGEDYGNTDLNTIYYSQWLAALEKFVNDKGLTSFEELVARKEQWRHVDEHRDFGQPLDLNNHPDHDHHHHHHHHHQGRISPVRHPALAGAWRRPRKSSYSHQTVGASAIVVQ